MSHFEYCRQNTVDHKAHHDTKGITQYNIGRFTSNTWQCQKLLHCTWHL